MNYRIITTASKSLLLGILISILPLQFITPQNVNSLSILINGYKSNTIYLYSVSGEKLSMIDSIKMSNGQFNYLLSDDQNHSGMYRITTANNKSFNFIYDGEDISLSADMSRLDSIVVIESQSNKKYFEFLRMNKLYKETAEVLQYVIFKYPAIDEFYFSALNKIETTQKNYSRFIEENSNGNSFISKYIKSAQLPQINYLLGREEQLRFLKSHSLDKIDFNDEDLINSDLFTNKSIEYLFYFSNPQLPKELLEKEFMSAVDSILLKSRRNANVYKHIVEYLIDGFRKFGFDLIIDYIVENYVIADDICLTEYTERLVKRRIDFARLLKIGNKAPDVTALNDKDKNVKLSSLKFEKALLVFYSSSCPHCKELLPKLNELKKANQKNGFEIVAVSLDDKKDEWLKFIKANCGELINFHDSGGWEGKSAEEYHIYATPTMIFLRNDLTIISKPQNYEEVKSLMR